MLTKQSIEFATAANPESVLLRHLAEAVSCSGDRGAARWRPGRRLNLLLSGYFGAGNVGSDMRTGEILRHVRFLLGETQVEFSALALSAALDGEVYRDVRNAPTAGYIPDSILSAVTEHDGVLACEGSMFKSTFSDVLSAAMGGSLGMAVAQKKLAVGYGAEIGSMNEQLREFVQKNVGQALILCRNETSKHTAVSLGLRAQSGADTAWTFQAASRERAVELLKTWGWNGSDPVLIVCPIHPFWWPVRPDPRMALAMHRTGEHRERAYGALFFHTDSSEIQLKYRRYIDGLAQAVRRLAARVGAFTLVLGMERVDRQACVDLTQRLELRHAAVLGADYTVAEVIAVLRASSLLVSSRFHALVGAMPAAVPSVGVSMDERIGNLFGDLGQRERVVPVDAEDLDRRILSAVDSLDPGAVAAASHKALASAIRSIGEMGLAFTDEVGRVYPEFPVPQRQRSWEAHVPPLPEEIRNMLFN